METGAAGGAVSADAKLGEAQARFDESLAFSADMQAMTTEHTQNSNVQDMLFETEQSDNKRFASIVENMKAATDAQTRSLAS